MANAQPPTHGHVHPDHPHRHGPGCGHTAIQFDGRVDYLHDGHLHHVEDDGSIVEDTIPISDTNPDACNHAGAGVEPGHVHGPGCGHEPIPHGNHIDYLVEGRLQHQHGDHIDDHGPVTIVQPSA